MLLSGFTFIRNAKKYDFPVVECIESMLPIVDELVVNVGDCDDGTHELIAGITSSKIKLIQSVWDDSKTDKGLVLSEQTNIALDACQGRWCLYLQADEALLEGELAYVREQVERADREPTPVDGFRFRYLHFYGGYTLVQRTWDWYPSEIRIVRRSSGLRSYGDAQTFKNSIESARPSVPLLDAHVYHYGHARKPEVMAHKIRYFHRFWHGDGHGIRVDQAYRLRLKNMAWFWGAHPSCYARRVEEGRDWSPRPSRLVRGAPFERVVLVSTKAMSALAQELARLIEDRSSSTRVEIVQGWRSWLKAYFTAKPSRARAALIDLAAETRSLPTFLGWVGDAVGGFGHRVAHAPNGTLSRFRARFYDAVNWGCHEKREQGFVVPPAEQAKQLARWLGLDL